MKTRKLLLVIVLALIITVGGVYATWNYSEKEVGSLDATAGFKLSAAVNNTKKGSVELKTNDLKFLIDQADSSYNSKLVVEGKIEILFTPDANVADSIVDDLTLVWNIKHVGTADITSFKYNDGTGEKAIFNKFDTATKTIIAHRTDNADGTVTFEVCAQDIIDADVIGINTFCLDTVAKYQALETILGTIGNINVVLSEQVA